jgi:hypothetical protein
MADRVRQFSISVALPGAILSHLKLRLQKFLRGRDGIDVLNRTNAALKNRNRSGRPHFSPLVARV